MIGFLWDYVWELSELTYSSNLFTVCQPLSHELNSNLCRFTLAFITPKNLYQIFANMIPLARGGLTHKNLAGKITPDSNFNPIIL